MRASALDRRPSVGARCARWALVIGALAVLAGPVVPDEPFHLSGYTVGGGVAALGLALLIGIVSCFYGSRISRRSAARTVGVAAMSLVGIGVWFWIRILDELA